MNMDIPEPKKSDCLEKTKTFLDKVFIYLCTHLCNQVVAAF